MDRIYLTVQMQGFCGVCYLSINQTGVSMAVGTIKYVQNKSPFPADTLLQPNRVWNSWHAATAPLFCLFFFLIGVEVAAQRLCLQNIWMSTGSSGVSTLIESSCPPQSFLPLLICGFQPCHSAFYSNFRRVSNIFYLIKSHLTDNLLVSFNFSLILELADGALASGIGSFSASSFHYSILHFIRQRCNICLEAPA